MAAPLLSFESLGRDWLYKVLLLLVTYQREVDKAKLTAVASFEKLTFRLDLTLLRRRAHARNISFSKIATAVNFLQVDNLLSVSLAADAAQQFL